MNSDGWAPWKNRPVLYWGTALGGTAAFCVYSQSWQGGHRIIYDLCAGVAVFSFVAQIVVEAVAGQGGRCWWSRAAALVPMSVVPAGRVLLHWPISGHATDVLIVAGVQVLNRRLAVWLRALYCLAAGAVVGLRWFHFDTGGHWETLWTVVIAAGWVGLAALACKGGGVLVGKPGDLADGEESCVQR